MTNQQEKIKRKSFNTTIQVELFNKIRKLAFNKNVHMCDLIEEGLKYVLDKYKDDLN